MSGMEQLTFLSEEAHANPSPSPETARGLQANQASCSSIYEQFESSCQHRGGAGPRYILWENVPGALSSERGLAFGQLLAELDELGYGLAWRVFDAQFARVPGGARDGFFGPVAQRRRRVFIPSFLQSFIFPQRRIYGYDQMRIV